MESASSFDLIFRGGVGAFALLLTALSLSVPRRSGTCWAFGLLGLGLTAYIAVSSPAFDTAGPLLFWALVIPALAMPVILWWAGLEFFDEADAFRRIVAPAAGVFVLSGIVGLHVPIVASLRGMLTAVLYAHLLYIAWASGPTDLVEPRRQARRVFLTLGALLGLIITAEELGLFTGMLGAEKHVLQSATLAVLLGGFLFWFAAHRDELLATDPEEPPTAPTALTPAELAVADRLNTAMNAGCWKEEGLTIAALAERIGTTEHRLRRVINKGLGHRNFTRFLNERRIVQARTLLADPAQADTAILTLAYEVGFASLGPFNRAFRDMTGQSPSEYRATHLPKPD